MKKYALVVLAEGFEEIEAVTPIDLLRRADINVCVAGLNPKNQYVTGSHGIPLKIDNDLNEIKNIFDASIFPGGMPGANNLASSAAVLSLIRHMNAEKKIIAAICASPAILLAPLGILDRKTATCYPGMEDAFPSTTRFSKKPVVVDGHIVTSRSAKTAIDFSLKIIELLINKKAADAVRAKIQAD